MKRITITSIKIYVAALSVITLLFASCEKEKVDPVIEATGITGISFTDYHVSAKITEKGDYVIFDYGFEYAIAAKPESYYNYQKKSLGSVIKSDTFSTNLQFENIYYQSGYKCFARAYITNEKGTIYSKFVSTELVMVKLISVSPESGRSGDTITLNGQYFNPVPTLNEVKFNDYVTAQVISGSTTMLKVIVPTGATNFYNSNKVDISITIDGNTSTLQNIFAIRPSVFSFSPNSGNWNTNISIMGEAMYGASVFFDDTFITDNTYSSTFFDVNIPETWLKKKFKIFVEFDGEKTEVPGGYFTMEDLTVSEPWNNQYYRGAYLYLNGGNFRAGYSTNKLFLGDYTIVCNYCSSSYSIEFEIPYNIPIGTYIAKCTNGLDTVTLNTPIQIIGK